MWSLIVSSQTAAELLHWQCRGGEEEEHNKIVVTQSDAEEEKVRAASGSKGDMLFLAMWNGEYKNTLLTNYLSTSSSVQH